MRTVLLTLIAIMALVSGEAQDMDEPRIGEVLVMTSADANGFDHVYFPKLNFILKRGGVGNWTSIRGIRVVVKEEYPKDNSNNFVVLARADGRKFFNVLPTVTASFNKALESGELRRI